MLEWLMLGIAIGSILTYIIGKKMFDGEIDLNRKKKEEK